MSTTMHSFTAIMLHEFATECHAVPSKALNVAWYARPENMTL